MVIYITTFVQGNSLINNVIDISAITVILMGAALFYKINKDRRKDLSKKADITYVDREIERVDNKVSNLTETVDQQTKGLRKHENRMHDKLDDVKNEIYGQIAKNHNIQLEELKLIVSLLK